MREFISRIPEKCHTKIVRELARPPRSPDPLQKAFPPTHKILTSTIDASGNSPLFNGKSQFICHNGICVASAVLLNSVNPPLKNNHLQRERIKFYWKTIIVGPSHRRRFFTRFDGSGWGF